MIKFIRFCHFIFKHLLNQPYKWTSVTLFYITSFLIVNQLLSTAIEPSIVWAFYLFMQNFAVALLLKDTFYDDTITTRLHVLNSKQLNLVYHVLSTNLIHAVLIFVLHLIILLIMHGFFQLTIFRTLLPLMAWQACSALLLTLIYLFGAALSQNSRIGVFFSLVIVMPSLIPWFLISYEFLLNNNYQVLAAIAALLMLMLPIMLYAQCLILRSTARL